jgi:hypothetical protein
VPELRDRARRQLGDQRVEALDQPEDAQYPNECRELTALARLDSLDRALGNSGLLRQRGLTQSGVDAQACEPLTQFAEYRRIGQFGSELRKSP